MARMRHVAETKGGQRKLCRATCDDGDSFSIVENAVEARRRATEELQDKLAQHAWQGHWSLRHNRPKLHLNGTQTEIARRLGIPLGTLSRRLKKKGDFSFFRGKTESPRDLSGIDKILYQPWYVGR